MKYSPERIKEICTAIREGSSQKDACILAGINVDTFHDWKKNKPEFSEILEKAELECKNRNIKIIQKAAITTWQAAAWWMERRYFMEFGLKHQLAGTDGQPLTIKVVNFSLNGKIKPLALTNGNHAAV